MIGSAVYDVQNRKIGKVRDLVLDRSGQIAAVVVDVGSFLGMGGKNVAVKPSDIKTDHNRLTLDVTKEQLQQMGQQAASGLSQAASTMKDAAQQAAAKAQQTGSTVSDLAQQSARKMKQTAQDVASSTKKTAASVKQGGQTSTMAPAPDVGAEEPIILVEPMVADEGA